MKTYGTGVVLGQVLVFSFWLVAIGGWVANAVKVIGAIGGPVDTMFVLRCVGILFAPLGVILGFV